MTDERKARLLALLPALGRDLVTLAGVGLLSYGAWLVYAPAGFIVCGALLLLAGVIASRASAVREREARETTRTVP